VKTASYVETGYSLIDPERGTFSTVHFAKFRT
jgi:hypothetical protein